MAPRGPRIERETTGLPESPLALQIAAVDAARDTVKQLVTVSVAVLTLTTTFATSAVADHHRALRALEVAWGAHVVSVAFGLYLLLRLVGQLDRAAPPAHELDSRLSTRSIAGPALAQLVSFAAGVAAMVVAGWQATH